MTDIDSQMGIMANNLGLARQIERGDSPVLAEWLQQAAKVIRIRPELDSRAPMGQVWAVEVGNDQTDWDYECAVMARCNTEAEAELVAVALWALVS